MKKYFAERFKERFKNKFGDFSDESFLIIPSFVDVHVHLREPGFFYKETIASGSRAAAASGYSVTHGSYTWISPDVWILC